MKELLKMNYVSYIRTFIGKKPVIFPGAMVIVENEKNEILLQLRADTNDWGIVGGIMEIGNTFEETAKKELKEETGLTAESMDIIDTFSGIDTHFIYPNGDETYGAIAVFKTTKVSGQLKWDNEAIEIKYHSKEEVAKLKLHPLSEKLLRRLGYLV
jgi:8-oxo-dGTP pyrophosphatase MutT (NUDIX family)